MLRFSQDLISVSVMSLDRGRKIASVDGLLINPENLSVAALICSMSAARQELYLIPQDIHDFSFESITVQNESDLSEIEDMVRLQKFLQISFTLIGKKIISNTKRRVGTVTEYVVDDKSFFIQKIYAKPPLTKVLSQSSLIISRNQVVEVNDREIVVKEGLIKKGKMSRVPVDA